MKWGVFDRRTSFDKTVHVVQCDEHDRIAPGHRIFLCECGPRVETFGAFTLLTHRGDT